MSKPKPNVVFGNPSGTKPCTIEVPVTFIFECIGEEGRVMQNIHNQIVSDLNEYYQNEDDTAQLTQILIHEWKPHYGEHE